MSEYYNREIDGYRFHAETHEAGTRVGTYIEFEAEELPPDDIIDRAVMAQGLYGADVIKYPDKVAVGASGWID